MRYDHFSGNRRKYTKPERDGRSSVKDSYAPDAWSAWDNEPKLQLGRPYDGAIINADGELVIPKQQS